MEFLEEAQVVRCEYCGSSLLVAGRAGVLRYVVPEGIQEGGEAEALALSRVGGPGGSSPRAGASFLFYTPFWRMKGMAYCWIFGQKTKKFSIWENEERLRRRSYGERGGEDWQAPFLGGILPERSREKELLARSFDHTLPACADLDLGLPTLGIRTQALRLRPLEKEDLEKRSSFLPLDISKEQAQEGMQEPAKFFLNPQGFESEVTLHRFVGRSLMIIYFPLWYVECGPVGSNQGVVIDAVGKRVLKERVDGSAIQRKLGGPGTRKSFDFSQIRFLPFRCPNCGWGFPFYPLSRIHFCPNCRRLYREKDGKWAERSYGISHIPAEFMSDGIIWLPFWRSRAVLESGDRKILTMADLFALIPPLRAFDPVSEARRPIYFYFPAMKFKSPHIAQKLASRLTFLQPDIAPAPFPDHYHPMTAGGSLADGDFLEMGPIILGGMIPPGNRKILNWLKDCRVDLQDPQILYLPFTHSSFFWKEIRTGIAFQHRAGSEDMPDQ